MNKEEQAEKFAIDYHYPDSVAKGIRESNGMYFKEIQETIDIFLKGYDVCYTSLIIENQELKAKVRELEELINNKTE